MHKRVRSQLSDWVYSGIRMFGGTPKGVRILCYHHVNDDAQDYVTVSTQQFRAQMGFLAEHGYRTVSLKDVVEGRFDAKSVVLTFDDGYEDNYVHAYPIMKQFGFTATIFMITRAIGTPGYLTEEQLKDMKSAGFDLGSHTLSHAVLKGLERIKKWDEIVGSKKALEDLLGDECSFICYPKGLYDAEAVRMVREAGYQGACSNHPGSEVMDPYLLKRTEIAQGDHLNDFRKKIAGAYDWMHQTLHILRGRP